MRVLNAGKKILKPALKLEVEAAHLHGQAYAFEMILEYIHENNNKVTSIPMEKKILKARLLFAI
jgi:hypothetical protein